MNCLFHSNHFPLFFSPCTSFRHLAKPGSLNLLQAAQWNAYTWKSEESLLSMDICLFLSSVIEDGAGVLWPPGPGRAVLLSAGRKQSRPRRRCRRPQPVNLGQTAEERTHSSLAIWISCLLFPRLSALVCTMGQFQALETLL